MLRFASFEPDMKQSRGFRENEASDVIDHVLLAKRIRYSFVYLIQASKPRCRTSHHKLKQKQPLPSIEYIYSKLTYFPEGQQFTKNAFIGFMKYSNLLRLL